MSARQIMNNLEKELRNVWGWKLNAWLQDHAKNVVLNIYRDNTDNKDNTDNTTIQAKNLYYAMESYIHFSDSRSEEFLIKDLLVFLERIITNQFSC